MLKFWEFAINMGNSEGMTQQERAQISFFNLICIINSLVLLGLSVFNLFSQIYLVLLLLLWQIFVCVLCLYSTANNRFVFSYRFWGLNGIIGTLLGLYFLGESSNLEMLFVLYFLILSIFSQSQKETLLWLVACLLGISCSFLIYEFFSPIVKYPSSILVKLPNLIFFLGIICLHSLFYRKDTIRNQQLLQENEEKYQRESAKRKQYSREFQLAQIELKENEEKYQLLFDNASDGIMLLDILALRIILMNDSFSRLLNKEKKELMELPLSDIMDIYFPEIENKEQKLLSLQKSLSKGEILEEKICLSDEQGKRLHLQLSAIPMPRSHKHLLAIFIRDLSHEVQEEERMKATLGELQEVNEELKNFAYIVSHDLKAPLRAIGSLADWLEEDHKEQLNPEGQEIVRLVNSRVERMHNLLEGVLAYSRVSRDKEEKVDIDTKLLIDQVIDSLAPEKHIEILIEGELAALHFDRTRLFQLFQNLISNAINFMDKAHPFIQIGCEIQTEEVRIWVSDNGPGIEESYYHKIFQVFQTLQARDTYESLGMGLAIVKKIVDRYEGRISLQSEIGAGCCFEIFFPRETVEVRSRVSV